MRRLAPDVTDGPRLDILDCVREDPGLHLRGIERATSLPLGQVLYHLDRLERMGLLVSHKQGGFRRYFPMGAYGRKEKPVVSAIHHDVPRRVLQALLATPGLQHADLKRHARVAGSTMTFHLKRLVDAGVLERRDDGVTTYALRHPEAARKVLAEVDAPPGRLLPAAPTPRPPPLRADMPAAPGAR